MTSSTPQLQTGLYPVHVSVETFVLVCSSPRESEIISSCTSCIMPAGALLHLQLQLQLFNWENLHMQHEVHVFM